MQYCKTITQKRMFKGSETKWWWPRKQNTDEVKGSTNTEPIKGHVLRRGDTALGEQGLQLLAT